MDIIGMKLYQARTFPLVVSLPNREPDRSSFDPSTSSRSSRARSRDDRLRTSGCHQSSRPTTLARSPVRPQPGAKRWVSPAGEVEHARYVIARFGIRGYATEAPDRHLAGVVGGKGERRIEAVEQRFQILDARLDV